MTTVYIILSVLSVVITLNLFKPVINQPHLTIPSFALGWPGGELVCCGFDFGDENMLHSHEGVRDYYAMFGVMRFVNYVSSLYLRRMLAKAPNATEINPEGRQHAA